MKLVLLRHGETEWNVEGRLMSRTDGALSAEGRDNVARVDLGKYARDIEYVATSPSLRARETAEIVSSANSLGGLPTQVYPELREMDFGDFEGRTHGDLRDDPLVSSVFASWYSDSVDAQVPPGGESWADASARARTFLDIAQEDGRDALVAAHGYIIRLIIVTALKMPHPASIRRFSIGNGCYSVLKKSDNGMWRLSKHNISRGEA